MANHMKNFVQTKTYKTSDNAHRAVKDVPDTDHNNEAIRYFIAWNEEGRCYPIFVGRSAVQAGLHFRFSVVG
jgi:hypothetical protein